MGKITRTGAQLLVRLLERQGVDTVAGMPGGAALPLYDALYESRIRHVLARHEQGAGYIAHGLARATGRPGVCLATSGPGATNLVTPIADAKLDSIPLVAITGQVSRSLIGTDAFQEVDTFGLTIPVAKHSFFVRDARELLGCVPRAFELAASGRPGPVVIDVPKDVQLEPVSFDHWPAAWEPTPRQQCDPCAARRIAGAILQARRPVLLVGGGAIASGAREDVGALARRQQIPVVASLNGLGVFPADDPLWLGMLGMHGARATNLVLEEADLLLAFGVRFDDRATGRTDDFCTRAKIVHVDVDPSELGKIVQPDIAVAGDVREVLRSVLLELPHDSRGLWLRRVRKLCEEHPLPAPADPPPGLVEPTAAIRRAARAMGPGVIVTTDVGQHQMWAAQVVPFRHPRSLLTSGGLGAMGFGLPAAMGAALARPDARVLCVSGDGSILINVQELATLAELELDVSILVLDNGHLGLVRQQQELFYQERFSAARFERRSDFAAIARGFGVRAVDLGSASDPLRALDAALEERGPCLIRAPIEEAANVWPMVPPGAANRETLGPPAVQCGSPPSQRRRDRRSLGGRSSEV